MTARQGAIDPPIGQPPSWPDGDDDRHAAHRYTAIAIALHWLTAAAFAAQIGLGWRMQASSGPTAFVLFQLHKSIGITILMLTIARVAWRWAHPAPPLSPTLTRFERRLAGAAHRGFYVLLIALPLTGWLIVSSSARRIPTVLFGLLPWPHLPVPPAAAAWLNGSAGGTHYWLAWIALLLIALHVAGALKHQWLDRDGEFGRMAPLPAGIRSAAVIVAIATFCAIIAVARTWDVASAAAPGRRHAPSPRITAPALPTSVAPPVPAATPRPPIAAATATTATIATIAAPAAPSHWAVRKGSTLGFRTAWSQGSIIGGFGTWTADIVFAPTALAGSAVTVTIDLASVTAQAPDQQSALPNADWFAVASHPKAIFHATRFEQTGADRYLARGTLALRGVTRPQTLAFTLTIAGDKATMTGTATIDRTAFGVGQGEWATTDDLPADVAVTVAIKADRISATRRKP